MKKGGVREINSFIAVPNTSSKPSTSSKPARTKQPSTESLAGYSSRESDKVSSTTSKVTRSNSIRTTNTKSSTELSRQKSISSTPSKSNNLTKSIASKSKENKIDSISTKNENVAKSSATKRKPTNSDDKRRGISFGTITMEDVYRKRLSRIREEKAHSSVEKGSQQLPFYEETKKAKADVVVTSNNVSSTITNVPVNNTAKSSDDTENQDYEYEDDFEDYESDFDSYSESNDDDSDDEEKSKSAGGDLEEDQKVTVEEEKKMDSGSYDLYQSQKQKNQLEIMKQALLKENAEVQQLSQFFGNSDFIETNFTRSISETSNDDDLLIDFDKKSLQKFTDAKKRQQTAKTYSRIKARGEKLMKMITLDMMQYSLFEMNPVPYDVFMRCYARKDISQAYTQTNEDNISSETQTEETQMRTKWTQYPISLQKNTIDETCLHQVLLGVGEDGSLEYQYNPPQINTQRLTNFMKSVGEEMIALLEEESASPEHVQNNIDNNSTEISSCVSYINCGLIPFLQDRPVLSTVCDPNSSLRFFTVHGNLKKEDDNQSYFICIWNINQLLKPKIVLKSYGSVSTCCFVCDDSSFVIAGHTDGSLCLWDLRESALYYEKLVLDRTEICIRLPSYNTVDILKNTAHNSKIVKIDSAAIDKDEDAIAEYSAEFRNKMIYSIEEENILIKWTLSRSLTKLPDICSAPWSKIKFFINQIIDISLFIPRYTFRTTNLKLISENNILIGTNASYVIKCSSYDKKCKTFCNNFFEQSEEKSSVTCLEVNPYVQHYFAVGYNNGNIRLYNCHYSEPVSNLKQRGTLSVSVLSLQWLWRHNYILSLNSNSTLCIYHFHSECYTNYTVVCNIQVNNITSVVLSSDIGITLKQRQKFLIFRSVKDGIQIHKLNKTLKINEE